MLGHLNFPTVTASAAGDNSVYCPTAVFEEHPTTFHKETEEQPQVAQCTDDTSRVPSEGIYGPSPTRIAIVHACRKDGVRGPIAPTLALAIAYPLALA